MNNPKIVEAWLADQRMQRLEKYLREGRRLRDFSTDTLRDQWVDQVKQWAFTVQSKSSPFDHSEQEDIEAEFSLRKVEEPFERVKDELAIVRRAAEERGEQIMRDPERFSREVREFHDVLKEFESNTKGRRN